MNLLLISNSTNFGEPYLAWATNQIEYFCEKTGVNAKTNIVFVPFAGVT
jgi:peptidase E